MARFKSPNNGSIIKWVCIFALIYIIFYATTDTSIGSCGCCTVPADKNVDSNKGDSNDGAIEGFTDIGAAGMGNDIVGSSTYSGGLGNGIVDMKYPDVPPSGDTLDMLSGQTFQPNCCPSTYSNSSGCACMSNEQLDFLSSRGGNR